MLGAARHALGRLDERYVHLEQDHENLANADRAIAQIREAVEAGRGQPDRLMLAWLANAAGWQARLRRDEAQSLFNEPRLVRAIEQARDR